MKTIWKFEIGIGFSLIEIPEGAVNLHVDVQGSERGLYLWALVDPEAPTVGRRFHVIGTGQSIDMKDKVFHGTVMDGEYVWHVFEQVTR